MRLLHRALPSCLAALLAAAAAPAATTFTVTTTADSGAGSLRQAITDANANPGADIIHFDISGGGVHTIAPAMALPEIVQAVTIDGYSQAGASANTNSPDLGLNTVLTIEIDCTNAGLYCLQIGADDVTIRGLAMGHTTGYLVATDFFKRVKNAVIEGCFLGTTPDGLTALPVAFGIILGNHENARVGGTTPAARNLFASSVGNGGGVEVGNALNAGSVIEGNLFCTDKTGAKLIGAATANGLLLNGGAGGESSQFTIGGLTPAAGNIIACPGFGIRLTSMNDVKVQGNKIGVDVSGTKAIGGGKGEAIFVESDGNNIEIGGTAAGAANVIGGKFVGVSGNRATVRGNFIGTDPTETLDLGNESSGIRVNGNDLIVGGIASGEPNAILHNRGGGVAVMSGSGNTIRGNRIFDNLGAPITSPTVGIDLTCGVSGCGGPVGPNPNDPLDADGSPGGNDLQNFPLLTSAAPEGSGTRVIGTLESAASSPYTLDFYANPTCRARPRAQIQADRYLGSVDVATNASGHATFNALLPSAISAGQTVTATATDANGSTSEFTPEIVFSTTPDFGVATGGQTLQIKGMLFSGTPTVTIGGVAATEITVQDPTQLLATVPARPAGAAYDLVVSMPGGSTGRMKNGYVSLPTDAGGSIYAAPIAKLIASGITQGCGAGIYCPNNTITRAEMAIFLIRAKFGLCFTPPPATGTVFSDVPANAFGAKHIELLASLGITSGCGGGKYCPNATVTRDAMAVFLLKTLLGSGFVPVAATGKFTDVPVSNPFAKWIEELARRNITGGCGFNIYCPNQTNTRGEMAAFITRTFGLP